MEFSREELRKLVFFFWKDKKNAVTISNKINSVLGAGSISPSTCQRWVSKFNCGEFDVSDAQRSGRPSNPMIEEGIIDHLKRDKYATTTEMAESLNVSTESVRDHLHRLGLKYMVNTWVPHRLTDANKLNRKTVCQNLLKMYENNDFLMRLVTVDECWIYWENDQRSYHNRSWVDPKGDNTTAVKRVLSKKKHLLTVFWDALGIIYMEVQPPGVNITSEIYCSQLEKMKHAIREKRRRTHLRDFFFIQDNARPHTAVQTTNKLAELEINVLQHPPYSPDLSPSDFYLFSPMKSSIRGRNYENATDIMVDINEWCRKKDRSFFTKAFTILPERWQKCILANGDYFQNLADTD